MSKKLLYKDELDNLFKINENKANNLTKVKKIKNKVGKTKPLVKDSLFSEKFSNKRRANSINDGLILPKLQFDK